MNSPDVWIVQSFNQLARVSPNFDSAMILLINNHLLKGAPMVGALWWVWGRAGTQQRIGVCSTLCACFVAMLAARALALLLPYRARPMHQPALDFTLPHPALEDVLPGWTSMPSDHAALYFALAGGLWLVSRRPGAFALAWAAFMVCLPRVYLGLHYPSDLAAGAVIGLLSGWLCARPGAVRRVAAPLYGWHERWPGPFYALMFLVSHQIASVFESGRGAAEAAGKFLLRVARVAAG